MRSYRSSTALRMAVAAATICGAIACPLASAQQSLDRAIKGEIKQLRSGPLLVHGNYCGVGSRNGAPPIDALDAACMRHDACTKTGSLPTCACDEQLYRAATTIAQDPGTPPKVQVLASATATGMALLICKK